MGSTAHALQERLHTHINHSRCQAVANPMSSKFRLILSDGDAMKSKLFFPYYQACSHRVCQKHPHEDSKSHQVHISQSDEQHCFSTFLCVLLLSRPAWYASDSKVSYGFPMLNGSDFATLSPVTRSSLADILAKTG